MKRSMGIKKTSNKNDICSRIEKVLFACVHNSGRSQMAEAFAVRIWNEIGEFESAGTQPADKIDPLVIMAMRENGIDLSLKTPKLLTEEMIGKVDRVITMGCSIEDVCPALYGIVEDWDLEDPAGKSLEEIRVIRDKIESDVREKLFNGTQTITL